jgi:hypothetical protein
MHRALTLAVVIASVAVGGAAAAENRPNHEHHYYWVTFPPDQRAGSGQPGSLRDCRPFWGRLGPRQSPCHDVD